MFGAFDVRVQGRPVLRWRAGRSRILLQYLLVHLDKRISTDRLNEVIWPETESDGKSSLKVACHGLRTVLDASRDESRPLRLLYRDSGYILQIDDVWIDVAEFERLVDVGLRAAKSGTSSVARRNLEAAMRLYTGDFLEGETADWVIAHREYLKSLALRALDTLRQFAEQEGDVREVMSLCRRTLDLDRYHEPSFRALVTLHGRLGELERARGWFRLCFERLRHDLGVAPEPTTIEAYRYAVARHSA
jgi:DNA-binding SARP family transcriptional activator